MRQYLAKLLLAAGLGGCSIIYNPSSITGDARTIDVEVVTDVNPSALELDSVFPDSIYEGAGTDGTGSAPALVVVRGKQIAEDAVVTATSDKGTVAVKDFKVAHDANWIAVVLQAPVDTTNDEPATGTITITVTQNGGATMATQAVTLKFLDQLKAPITSAPAAGKIYSQIDVGALAFAKNGKRVVLRSMSDVKIASIDASGGSPDAGPGGCKGGGDSGDGDAMSADGVACAGRGHHKGGNGGGGGGGGGYAAAGTTPSNGGAGGDMVGDDHVSKYGENIGGGGGGGEATIGVIGGQPGGGSGGVVQIDGRGNLTVTGAISVKGGTGTNNNGALGGGAGGGGSGGTIVARAFGMLSIGSVDLSAGGGGPGTGPGGAGASGRMRVDAAKGTPPGAAYIGPMMVDPPAYSTNKMVMIDVVGTANTGDTTMAVYKPDGNLVDNASKFQVNIAGTGKGQVPVPLGPGYNKVCTTVGGGSLSTDDEATSCIEIAYLP